MWAQDPPTKEDHMPMMFLFKAEDEVTINKTFVDLQMLGHDPTRAISSTCITGIEEPLADTEVS